MNLAIHKRLLLLNKKNKSLLPSEYQQVEYVESTGTQYIDTNQAWIHPLSFKIRAQKTISDATNVFGATGTTSSTNTGYGGKLIFNANSGASGSQFTTSAYYNQHQGFLYVPKNSWVDVEFGSGYAIINGVEKTFTKGSRSSSFNIALFGLNTGGTITPSPVRITSFQIYQGDEKTLVRDMVACERISDGVVGMYDLCGSICPLTGTPFYINAGEGEFLKGADI